MKLFHCIRKEFTSYIALHSIILSQVLRDKIFKITIADIYSI